MRPVCPEAPVWPCGAACPCKQSHASHSVTCLPFSVQSSDNLPCLQYTFSVECQSLNSPVRPVCPEAPVWPVEPLAPASSHHASHSVTCLPFSVQSSDSSAMQCIHPVECQSLEPTCETRLPRSPGLSCRAACPCKQSPCHSHCVSCSSPSLCKALIDSTCRHTSN